MENKNDFIIFGGGCFWCTEAVFQNIKGVTGVTSGYAGGQTMNPTYYQVCTGETGHAEVVKVEFDPKVITLEDLLEIFFVTHDPTGLNRQGNDIGTQYRSLIIYSDQQQLETIKKFMDTLPYRAEVVTELKPFDKFYPAESEQQQYYAKNPQQAYCRVVINPKLAKLRAKYSQHLKK